MTSHAVLASICFLLSISLPIIVPLDAFADTLTCTLSSRTKSESVSLDLNDSKTSETGLYGKHGVYDLNFYLNANCKNKKCQPSITIDSGTVEDEVGQMGFEFIREKDRSIVFREPLTNSPDKRKYEMVCEYLP